MMPSKDPGEGKHLDRTRRERTQSRYRGGTAGQLTFKEHVKYM